MSAVIESGTTQTAAYGGLVDAVGGIGASVLAIVGLTGFDPEGMAAIATIVLGAAFVVQAGAVLSEYAHMASLSGGMSATDGVAGDGLPAMFTVGATGIVLGILALLGIATAVLIAISAIAFGGALLLSSSSVRALYLLRSRQALVASVASRSGAEMLSGQMASGSAGIQLLTGIAAAVLGILALAGPARLSGVLVLAALLVLGVTVLLTGSAISSIVLSFVRRPSSSHSIGTRA